MGTKVHTEKKTKSSTYEVSYDVKTSKWFAYRRNKHDKKTIYNGHFKSAEKAAHASDTLARKLVANGEQNHKLNFPADHTEAYPEERQRKRKRSDHEDLGHPKSN